MLHRLSHVAFAFIMSFSCLFAEVPSRKLWEEYLCMPLQREPALTEHGFLLGNTISEKQRGEIERALNKREDVIRVASFNILFNLLDHTLPPEYQWEKRLPRVVETISRIDPDIIGLQETQVDQLEDLRFCLGEEYAYLSVLDALNAVDPTNRFTDGILYRRDRFELVDEMFMYHTKTPKLPSIDPEANFPTVNHHVILKDKQTGHTFAVTNCHLYFFSPEIRSLAIDALSVFMKDNPDLPMLFLGDLNMIPPLLDYDLQFMDGYFILRKLRMLGFCDTFEESRLGHIGPFSTYTNSPETPQKAFSGIGVPGFLLDRIFVTSQILTLLHGIYAEKIDGCFPSDHHPVVVDLLITP